MCFVMIRYRLVHFLYDCHILYIFLYFNVEFLVKIVDRHYIVTNSNQFISTCTCSKTKNVKLMQYSYARESFCKSRLAIFTKIVKRYNSIDCRFISFDLKYAFLKLFIILRFLNLIIPYWVHQAFSGIRLCQLFIFDSHQCNLSN